MGKPLPRYPVYVPSKGRADIKMTARCLDREGVPFSLVVEPQEADAYAKRWGEGRLLILPENDRGLVYVRNWIKDHSVALGHERHWQIDDNITYFGRRYKARRIPCDAGLALSMVETFTDRYANVGISGMNYEMFLPPHVDTPPFYRNGRVYSISLILNELPLRFRGIYNEDVDYCLQVLSEGWCTILVNAFYAKKTATMRVAGGNTDALYHGDGRLKMARALERVWPGVVETRRRFQRPQHAVKDSWRKFDTPLVLKEGIDLAQLPKVDEQGMTLRTVREPKSEAVRGLVKQREEGQR